MILRDWLSDGWLLKTSDLSVDVGGEIVETPDTKPQITSDVLRKAYEILLRSGAKRMDREGA